jgi:hypothetical protein
MMELTPGLSQYPSFQMLKTLQLLGTLAPRPAPVLPLPYCKEKQLQS